MQTGVLQTATCCTFTARDLPHPPSSWTGHPRPLLCFLPQGRSFIPAPMREPTRRHPYTRCCAHRSQTGHGRHPPPRRYDAVFIDRCLTTCYEPLLHSFSSSFPLFPSFPRNLGTRNDTTRINALGTVLGHYSNVSSYLSTGRRVRTCVFERDWIRRSLMSSCLHATSLRLLFTVLTVLSMCLCYSFHVISVTCVYLMYVL